MGTAFVAVPLLFFRPWGYFSLVLMILSLGWSYLKYRDAGWDISSQQLVLRYRGIVRTTVFMKRNRIQSLTMSESYFQKKRSLATIEAVAMSGIGGQAERSLILTGKKCMLFISGILILD